MADDITIDENDLSEVEQIIYEALKDFQNEESFLSIKLKELQKIYNQYASNNNSTYHDVRRFGFLRGIADSEYKMLNREKIERQSAKIIDDMYNLVIEITQKLIGQKESLNYAIYFKKDEKVYRLMQNDINLELLNLSKSNQSMRLSAGAFKKFANQQRQTADITAHYNTFVNVLKETYRGTDPLPNKIVNDGIIAEAFERHLQNVHKGALNGEEDISIESGYDWSVDEAWRLIRQSRGNDPWYTGGDVGVTQVKNIGRGNVRLTSFSTVEDIVNFLFYLGQEVKDDNLLRQQAKQAFQVLYNEANDTINHEINLTAEEIIEEIFGKINLDK